jgi:hypothetical protein
MIITYISEARPPKTSNDSDIESGEPPKKKKKETGKHSNMEVDDGLPEDSRADGACEYTMAVTA